MRGLALLLLVFANPLLANEPIRVAVAANFKPTLEIISAQFEAATGQRVTLSSASTGVLYSQVVYGAPFHLLFAADSNTPAQLTAAGITESSPFCYAMGSLVLAGGNGSLVELTNPQLSLAIANPVTAPYGSAAAQVLAREEFAAGSARKLVRGNNVAQAYQFWHSGAAALALLPRSLLPDTGIPIPQGWHLPLEQHAVVLQRNTAVDAYLNWVRSDTVRSLIIEAGYQSCP